ncbi:MAG TPA: NAD(P)/FAD-dependent oxidoreductase [Pseudothermotoga sp.]|nr:NAD(P)/FAD-dependent oxidoreductase [Pseudothermotoga sp.]HOK84541.1 NAD(P)/FAD-dependent oxidoreductase [Pseudothermotoga sp.]HPP69452.1 NAD(P)/FAD-dependent oxidoreductase [Pseudothermotoga sp.]
MKVVVIGAGVVGSLILRELSRYDLELTIIEKNLDVGWGVTKANSAILHAGYDDPVGSNRAKFCAKGNEMYTQLSEELDFEIKRIGSYVVAFSDEEKKVIEELYEQGKINGVPNLEIHDRTTLLEKEPNLSKDVKCGLWAPTAGITEPWMVAIAAIENAVSNGARVVLNERVIGFEKKGTRIIKVITDKNSYETDLVINAAGLFADQIAILAEAEYVPLHPRRGEYILLDKKVGSTVRSIIFPTPTKTSKGILVLPTIDGGLLLGPTAVDLPSDMKNEFKTTVEGLTQIKSFTKQLVPSLDFSQTVKTFCGLRPESPQKDFFIGASARVENFINVMAMRSPGLTAAPAIAKYVSQEIIQDELGLKLSEKKDFNPFRKGIKKIVELPLEQWQELVKKDPAAGRLVCYCNEVTESEIVEAIRRGARTLDGVKFRTRAMFGRCQGGFCSIKIMKILERELKTDMSQIAMKSPGSWIVDGKVRE